MTNTQNLNRYGYVLNNPINLVDPSGHICTDPEDADNGISSRDCDKNNKPLRGNSGNRGGITGRGTCSSSICNSNSGGTSTPTANYGSGYSGPLPDDVVNILVAQGASQDLLDDITIDIETRAAKNGCGVKTLAFAYGNNVYVCQVISPKGTVVFDSKKPTPVLLHEFVHVRQFRDNFMGTFIEAQVNGLRKFLDPAFDPYQVSGNIEYEAEQCQKAFTANPNMSLDSGVCNLK